VKKKKKGTLFFSGCCPGFLYLFDICFSSSFSCFWFHLGKKEKGKKGKRRFVWHLFASFSGGRIHNTQHVPVSSIPTNVVGVGRLDYMPVLGLRCMCVCFPFPFLKENKEIKRKTHVAFIFSFTPHHLKYSSFSFYFCNMKHLGVLGPPHTTHRCALPRVHRSGGSNFSVDCCVVSLLQQLGDPPLFFCTSLLPNSKFSQKIFTSSIIDLQYNVIIHYYV
jgi:hypothetical protein